MVSIMSQIFRTGMALLMVFGILTAPVSANEWNKWLNVAKDGIKASQDIPEAKEIEMGEGLSARLLGAAGLVKDKEVQQYVNTVGLLLALQTERSHLPWRFGVLDTDTVNAFAAPGGNVFITRGLFMMLRSEDELAGVLAHEIGHVLVRHHMDAIKHKQQLGVAAKVAGGYLNADKRITDAVFNSGMELYARGLDRDDEIEADQLGVVIATRAGYDPFGLPMVLQTMDRLDPGQADLSFMLATHPPTHDRLVELDQAMGTSFNELASSELHQRKLLQHQERLFR